MIVITAIAIGMIHRERFARARVGTGRSRPVAWRRCRFAFRLIVSSEVGRRRSRRALPQDAAPSYRASNAAHLGGTLGGKRRTPADQRAFSMACTACRERYACVARSV